MSAADNAPDAARREELAMICEEVANGITPMDRLTFTFFDVVANMLRAPQGQKPVLTDEIVDNAIRAWYADDRFTNIAECDCVDMRIALRQTGAFADEVQLREVDRR